MRKLAILAILSSLSLASLCTSTQPATTASLADEVEKLT